MYSSGEKMEWRQLLHFEIRGWDGFTTWASCDADGVVHVMRRMIHPDGSLHFSEDIKGGKPGFKLSLQVQRGVHNGGHIVVAPQPAERVLAYALDFIPFDVHNMAEATKYEALRIDDARPLSFENVGWYPKGETKRRGIRVSEESACDTEQEELENEVFANVKYRQYGLTGGVVNTWANEDGMFQVSTLGRLRYVLKDGGVFHYTKGSTDGAGYLHASIHRFVSGRLAMVHILVLHTFHGFPDDLGYNTCTTNVDHIDRMRSNNKLENLKYANPWQQGLNRFVVLEKHGVGSFADLPHDTLERATQYVQPQKPDKMLSHLETKAGKHLKDVYLASMQMFLRGKRLCDLSGEELKCAALIGECMFFFEYDEVEDIFEESDWIFPYENWKQLDVKLMVPRKRVGSILDALRAANVTLDRDECLKDDVMCIRLRLLFNRVMMYHHHLAKLAATSSDGKRKRESQ